MYAKKSARFATLALVATFVGVLVFSVARTAAQETIVLTYDGKNGAGSAVTMVADKAGNLYGTTNYGGASGSACNGNGCGTVFELVRGGGKYTYKIIHNFGSGTDGQLPNAQLTVDANGNLYGDTYQGGTNGFGAIFTMHRNTTGKWAEKVIYNFTGGGDGSGPQATLALDGAGNLYGTASGGGIVSSSCTVLVGCGTVFKLTRGSNGQWSETTLYQFAGTPDGWFPLAGLVIAKDGNLYGTTDGGGVNGVGTVYSLKRAHGVWSEIILHSFNLDGTDGAFPVVGLTADSAGNLYGPAINGGSTLSGCGGVGCGVIFELAAPTWTEKILYSFTGGNDGGGPATNLIFDGSGNLYSTDAYGGTSGTGCGGLGCGVVFELKPNGSGGWSESTIHDFGLGSDGYLPYGGVIFGADGNLYGTTYQGGTNNLGVVFKLVP
jgi:uncharacterized repeat protein (TIGR03803 family)